ncbi:DUF2283 domain-containing protein [Thiorhodovibrio frisius]|uniref:DUF2283 domain-containing protein n=1 Tax=Thiorhodovibrio frisius TaxID=631362 RepID=H8Z2S2_9GAMM|nr:DUF2283 domain-containing protein [Thiorhodovibrio frisius]EIC21658.1 Protein of unknown function (DUF2283) [Thiorhodovibrio frisius]WPL21626.1 hypothetical protein Thiofri_01752 [Thiorhodovibrio frisius]
MKITYYEEDDILFIEMSKSPVVRDESVSWNVNIGYTAEGIGEITILDAQKLGVYPLQIERVVSEAA